MKDKLILRDVNGVKFYQSAYINENSNIKHFFSTRIGGVSESYYKSLNLGVNTKDKEENIRKNISRVFEAANMEDQNVVYLNQVHGNTFYLVDEDNYVNIINSPGDALITRSRGIAIGVFTADCVPIILADTVSKVVAAVHAGWKGTNQQIVDKVINYMIDKMDCKSEHIIAAIGPSIGKCCFEVKEDVADKFKFVIKVNDKWFVDLFRENYEQIINCGLPAGNITGGDLCTMCREDIFYSHRRDKGNTGRLGAFIQIK